MKIQEILEYAEQRNFQMDSTMQQRFNDYMNLLIEWNEKMNLTAITDPEEIMEKHFLDCLLPVFSQKIKGKVVDVGSGAGFPGLVFAISLPNIEITLLEPTGKRCQFLEEVVKKLGLTNVEIVNERAEDYGKINREIFDISTARAVAPLNILSELCVPLVKKGGIFLSLKGTSWKEEYEQAKDGLHLLGCGEPEIQEEELPNENKRVMLYFPKESNTPKKYPRHYSQIKKKPL